MPERLKQKEIKKNWIERKAQREKVLKEEAASVWETARSAIQECCASFRAHYCESVTKLECEGKDRGNRIRLELTFKKTDEVGRVSEDRRVRDVSFTSSKPCIDVEDVTQGTPTNKVQFMIGADESHAFIFHDQERLTVDEFTQKALENFLFKAPKPQRR